MIQNDIDHDALIIGARMGERDINERLVVPPQHPQKHIKIGELVKSLVFSGVDGSTNTLVVILSSLSAGMAAHQVLLFAISICVADAVSMGLGDYLSAKAEIDFIKTEQERQHYQVEHLLEQEKKQIINIYMKKSYTIQEASRIADLYSTNRQVFVNIMMLEQLKLVVIDPSLAVKCGLTTFFSFLLFGIQPVLPYIITSGILKLEDQPWAISVCIGTVELFGLGMMKAAIIGLNKWKAGLQILIISAAAVAVGYGIGFTFSQ